MSILSLVYNFPIAPDLWVSIPKPFEIGVFASGAERLVDKMFFGNEDAFDGYAGSVARSTLPIDESALAGPYRGMVEVMTNYDFFRQKHIISVHEEGLALDKRNTERASRIGKAIQELSGLDGRYVDHLIKSHFSYYGKLTIKLGDLGRDDGYNQFNPSDLGIFRQSPVYGSKDVQWVLEKARAEGQTSSREYEEMQMLIEDYFDTTDSKEKEKRGKVVRDYAKALKELWDDENEKETVINR